MKYLTVTLFLMSSFNLHARGQILFTEICERTKELKFVSSASNLTTEVIDIITYDGQVDLMDVYNYKMGVISYLHTKCDEHQVHGGDIELNESIVKPAIHALVDLDPNNPVSPDDGSTLSEREIMQNFFVDRINARGISLF